MKKTRFTEEQIVTILRGADQKPVTEVAKEHRISDQTIYAWRVSLAAGSGELSSAEVALLRRDGPNASSEAWL